MSSHSLLSLTVVTALFSWSAGPGAAQTALRYKFKEGDVLPYRMTQDMKMAMNVMGMDIEINMGMGMDLTWKVHKVSEEGKADMTYKFGNIKVTMDGPMGKVEVSSADENEPDDMIGQIMYKMVKSLAKLEMTGAMDARGEIHDLKIPDAAMKELKKLAGGGPAAGMFSPDSLKGMVGGATGLVLPKEPVAKGKSWNHKSSTKTEIGEQTVDQKYTYEGAKDGLELITLQPKIDIKPKENAPISIKVKSADGKGQAIFDNGSGQVREVGLNQVIDMEMEIMGQTINQKMTVQTKMRQAKSK